MGALLKCFLILKKEECNKDSKLWRMFDPRNVLLDLLPILYTNRIRLHQTLVLIFLSLSNFLQTSFGTFKSILVEALTLVRVG